MNVRSLIIKTLKKNKKRFILFTFFFTLGSIALTINAFIASRFIGSFEVSSKEAVLENIKFWLIVFFIAKTLQNLNQYPMHIYKKVFETAFITDLIEELFETVHAHAIRYFDDEMTGRVSTAISMASNNIHNLFQQLTFSLLRPLINFLTGFAIIGCKSPGLAITLAFLCIPFFLIIQKTHGEFFKRAKERGASEREYSGIVTDSFCNYKAVRYTGSIFSEKLYAYKALKKYLQATWKSGLFHTFSRMGYGLAETLFTTSSYLAIIFFTAQDSISLGDAFFAFEAVWMLSFSIKDLNHFAQRYSDSYGQIVSSLELIYKPIEITDKPNAEKLIVKNNSLTLKNVSFSYLPGKSVLKNLNLTIKANQKVGLIGYSGAGKSTLISLILRAYEATDGKILIGNTNICDVTQQSLHQNIAYVPQDVTLFNRPLRENIKIANPKATDEDIIKAAKLAYIHDTIMALPNGYDSVVGERGILLSGGERQRIAIARAIVQNAPILILDEATSSLDSEAEVTVQNALDNLMKNKTVIAIAHRLSTLRAMDRIISLDKGKIIEDGTPKALLKKKDGLFKHLFSLQTNGYIITDMKNKEAN